MLLLLRVLLLNGLLLRLLLSFSIPIFSNVFDLGLIFLSFLLLLLALLGFFFFVVRHFSILLLLHGELDRVTNELAVLLHHIFDLLLVVEISLILLHGEHNLGASAQLFALGVGLDSEGASGAAFPHILLVVVVLARHGDLVGDEVGGVEADSELPNHGDISAGGQRLHERLGP